MDDAGDAIAAWPASDVAGPILVARRFDVTAGWPGGWAPAEIVARGWNGLGSLAMTPSGAAVAAWTNSATTASIAVYEVGRGWAAPAQVRSPLTTMIAGRSRANFTPRLGRPPPGWV